jgi:hypothetical protein
MPWPDDLLARLNEWGKAAFTRELETNFARARIFDSKFTKITFDVLGRFSPDQLKILVSVLPTLANDPTKTFSGPEQQLVDTFIATQKNIILAGHNQEKIIEQVQHLTSKPIREEQAKIKKIAHKIFKDIAKRCECEIERADISVWKLTRLERWGRFFLFLDLHEAMEFRYYFKIEDNDYRDVLEHEGYLNRIGIPAASSCQLTTAEAFTEKVAKVGEIIEWQLNDYSEILYSLNWPR